MLLSALFWLACGLSLLLPVALPCSVPSVHPDRAFSASKCITRGSGAGDMGRRSVFGDRGRCGLAGRGASAPRHGSGRSPRRGSGLGPAAGDGFESFRGIQPGCALRRFSAGPSGRSWPRFPMLPCCTSRHIHATPLAFPCPPVGVVVRVFFSFPPPFGRRFPPQGWSSLVLLVLKNRCLALLPGPTILLGNPLLQLGEVLGTAAEDRVALHAVLRGGGGATEGSQREAGEEKGTENTHHT